MMYDIIMSHVYMTRLACRNFAKRCLAMESGISKFRFASMWISICEGLAKQNLLSEVSTILVELRGSLALTGAIAFTNKKH